MSKNLAYFSSLSFGDLVIELNFLEIEPTMVLITPAYNKSLLNALGYKGKVEYFQYPNTEIPPLFFNFKSANYLGIISSFFLLRSAIIDYSKKFEIIFYESSWKWKLLSFGVSKCYLKSTSDNIYNSLINKYNLSFSLNKRKNSFTQNMVCSIFPDSRQLEKSIPTSSIEKIYCELLNYGFKVTVYTGRELKNNINHKNIATLNELDDIIRSSNLCITADSMPLHLSYYRKIPVFVFAKKLNKILFPPTIIVDEAWSNFYDTEKLKKWLDNYVIIF
jgi:ADP-heptose:LPS heptosyltransferase